VTQTRLTFASIRAPSALKIGSDGQRAGVVLLHFRNRGVEIVRI